MTTVKKTIAQELRSARAKSFAPDASASVPGRLLLAPVRGFCGGVRRALEIVDKLLKAAPGQTLYVYHEIVHNNFVVRELEKRNVRFVHALDEVPDGARLVWSAHGVQPALESAAQKRGLAVVDATCPLVRKLHRLAAEHSAKGDFVIFIGHAGHPETVGVLGCGELHLVTGEADIAALPALPESVPVTVLTQTTLSGGEAEQWIARLRERFPRLRAASGICYATAERQQAVRDLVAAGVDALVVIGSPKSSNSNRLCEVARACGVAAYLADDPEELRTLALPPGGRVGLTAGASAPEILVKRAVAILRERGFRCAEEPEKTAY